MLETIEELGGVLLLVAIPGLVFFLAIEIRRYLRARRDRGRGESWMIY